MCYCIITIPLFLTIDSYFRNEIKCENAFIENVSMNELQCNE